MRREAQERIFTFFIRAHTRIHLGVPHGVEGDGLGKGLANVGKGKAPIVAAHVGRQGNQELSKRRVHVEIVLALEVAIGKAAKVHFVKPV